MSISEVFRSLWHLAVVVALTQASTAAQQTIWVDANEGSDVLGDGSSLEDAYATISIAAEEANFEGGNRIIRVIEGDYTQAHELSGLATNPGYPIVITKPDIVIQGDDTDPEHYPRLGGDVAAVEESSAVEAIVQIVVPDGNDLSGIVLSRLRFVGEDTEDLDAPSALHVYCAVEQDLTSSGAVNCIFERPEMNVGFEDGRPTVLVESPNSDSVQFTLSNCKIWCSNRGGAELRIASEIDEEDSADCVLVVEESQVLIEGDDDARFGLAYTSEEDAAGTNLSALQTWRVVVDSTGANEGHGIGIGIAFLMTATDGKLIHPLESRIEACEVKGCLSDAILIFGEEDSGTVNMVLSADNFRLNRLHHNGGAGIHVEWADGTPYLSVNSLNNLIYRNQYGIWYEGLNVNAVGASSHKFDTISKNTSYAFRLDGSGVSGPSNPGPLMNSLIVWDNNSGGGNAQYGGTLSWNPQVDGPMYRSCWMNLTSLTNRNTNANPQLANTASDDYHLTSASTACIDLGDNLTGLAPTDLDLEDRTVNGNGQDGAEVDMGSDEYDP